MEQSQLVINFTILLGAALVGGMIAHRLRQPVILGYLIVGVAIGPHAVGLVNDSALVQGAAVIGVALLMLTLGIEVSYAQFRQVGKIGLWGGLAQILLTFALGLAAGLGLFRWSLPQSILFGLIISLSSTMVGLKLLMERGEADSVHGRIMIAILILQDVGSVLMIVILPVLVGAEQQSLLLTLGLTMLKAMVIISVAIAAGLWGLPWLMGRVGGVRARELFLLTVLVMGLGAALSTQLFGLSAVFGAFLVGIVLRETRFAHQALAEMTPLRDIFAALFFVSLGMLFDPTFVLDHWLLMAGTVALIILIKFIVVYGIVRIRYTTGVAVLTGAGLLPIGEFSFILAQDGVNRGVISSQSYSLLIGSAITSMLLAPFCLALASRLYPRLSVNAADMPAIPPGASGPGGSAADAAGRVVVAGFGRIGQSVARGLQDAGLPLIVVEIDPEIVCQLRSGGGVCVYGDASNHHVLSHLNLDQASALVVTFPDPLAVLATVRFARAISPNLKIVARVHRQKDAEELRKLGAEILINPEYEASLEFIRRTLAIAGRDQQDIKSVLATVRSDQNIPEFCSAKDE